MKKLTIFLLLAVGASASAQPTVPTVYGLSVLCENKSLEIVVNGFPFAQIPDSGNQGNLNALLSPFIKTGTNVIQVNARPLTSAAGEVDALLVLRCTSKPNMEAEVTTPVFEVERTDNPTNSQPNARTSVKIGGEDVFRLLAPGRADGDSVLIDVASPSISFVPATNKVVSLHIKAVFPDAPLASLPWEGEPAALTEADRAVIRAKIEDFHQAVIAADFEEIARLLDAKYSRVAAAAGVPKANLIAEETALLSKFIGKPGFVFQPFNPAALVFQPVGGVNLVRATSGADGPINGADAEVRFSITPFFSKSGNDWILVDVE